MIPEWSQSDLRVVPEWSQTEYFAMFYGAINHRLTNDYFRWLLPSGPAMQWSLDGHVPSNLPFKGSDVKSSWVAHWRHWKLASLPAELFTLSQTEEFKNFNTSKNFCYSKSFLQRLFCINTKHILLVVKILLFQS